MITSALECAALGVPRSVGQLALCPWIELKGDACKTTRLSLAASLNLISSAISVVGVAPGTLAVDAAAAAAAVHVAALLAGLRLCRDHFLGVVLPYARGRCLRSFLRVFLAKPSGKGCHRPLPARRMRSLTSFTGAAGPENFGQGCKAAQPCVSSSHTSPDPADAATGHAYTLEACPTQPWMDGWSSGPRK